MPTKTIYTRSPEVWEWALRQAHREDISLSAFIEKCLREAKERREIPRLQHD